mmetsp:Transcript_9357/g.33093  ORF Transcript_9357/g.33093 Transcript_9357/m.33093 type:complete len:215 (-) Transcript_9357:2192-2836(-)
MAATPEPATATATATDRRRSLMCISRSCTVGCTRPRPIGTGAPGTTLRTACANSFKGSKARPCVPWQMPICRRLPRSTANRMWMWTCCEPSFGHCSKRTASRSWRENAARRSFVPSSLTCKGCCRCRRPNVQRHDEWQLRPVGRAPGEPRTWPPARLSSPSSTCSSCRQTCSRKPMLRGSRCGSSKPFSARLCRARCCSFHMMRPEHRLWSSRS